MPTAQVGQTSGRRQQDNEAAAETDQAVSPILLRKVAARGRDEVLKREERTQNKNGVKKSAESMTLKKAGRPVD